MERIKLCCARCGFTIEEYTATELADLPRKAKRYKYLLNKSSICPSCLASGRLKEVRNTEGNGQGTSPFPAPAAASSTSAANLAPPSAHGAADTPALVPTPMMDAVTDGPWPSHAAEAQEDQVSGADCLATPCAICKAQLPVAFKHYGVEAPVVGVMDLLAKAIIL